MSVELSALSNVERIMCVRHVFWWVAVALALGTASGVAWAQQGGGESARPRADCVGARRVVRPQPAVAAALRTCRRDADCVIMLAGCCAPCSEPQPAQVRAVRRGREAAYRRAQCPRVVACPACAGPAPGPELHAVCVAARCEVAVDAPECAPPGLLGGGES